MQESVLHREKSIPLASFIKPDPGSKPEADDVLFCRRPSIRPNVATSTSRSSYVWLLPSTKSWAPRTSADSYKLTSWLCVCPVGSSI